MINLHSKIFIAGHRGMLGSSILRILSDPPQLCVVFLLLRICIEAPDPHVASGILVCGLQSPYNRCNIHLVVDKNQSVELRQLVGGGVDDLEDHVLPCRVLWSTFGLMLLVRL